MDFIADIFYCISTLFLYPFKRRIGRLAFLASLFLWGGIFTLLNIFLSSSLMDKIMSVDYLQNFNFYDFLPIVILFLASLIITAMIYGGRLHDLGRSSFWFWFLCIIFPVVIITIVQIVANIYGSSGTSTSIALLMLLVLIASFITPVILTLFCLFAPGREHENKYGAPNNQIPTSIVGSFAILALIFYGGASFVSFNLMSVRSMEIKAHAEQQINRTLQRAEINLH